MKVKIDRPKSLGVYLAAIIIVVAFLFGLRLRLGGDSLDDLLAFIMCVGAGIPYFLFADELLQSSLASHLIGRLPGIKKTLFSLYIIGVIWFGLSIIFLIRLLWKFPLLRLLQNAQLINIPFYLLIIFCYLVAIFILWLTSYNRSKYKTNSNK